MEPLTTNDDDLLVYCDWLEDEGRSEESSVLREDIINPNVDSWHWESCNYNYAGSAGSPVVGGSGGKGVGIDCAGGVVKVGGRCGVGGICGGIKAGVGGRGG